MFPLGFIWVRPVRLISHLFQVLYFFLFSSPLIFGGELNISVRDKETGKEIPSRIYISDISGEKWFFLNRKVPTDSIAFYDKTNWINNNAFERYSSITKYPGQAILPAGDYTVRVEKGKEYHPYEARITIGKGTDASTSINIDLERWIKMDELGWFSTETHIHRTIDDLKILQKVEDLNVSFPLTSWVTKSGLPPRSGDKNQGGTIPGSLIQIDETHVIWPRNTEYEIFTVNNKRHTLGALFILGHKSMLDLSVPPWKQVATQARQEGALMDMDKLDWPFSMILPQVTGAKLYELANNHMWRTDFAFSNWNSKAPQWMQPPFGGRSGTEWDWMRYTFGMYYTLLNAGFDIVPVAGTASGVHPVPIGFSRVYLPLGKEFSYERLYASLEQGKGFVTTGPMLLVKVNGQFSGQSFSISDQPQTFSISGEVTSSNPISFIEMIENGIPKRTVMGRNTRIKSNAYKTKFGFDYKPDKTSWVTFRCFEELPDGRNRFAHTGVWKFIKQGQPYLVTDMEKQYLSSRVETEINRSRTLLDKTSLNEYESALNIFKQLPTSGNNPHGLESRLPRSEDEKEFWLINSLLNHGMTPTEATIATGLNRNDIYYFLTRGELPNAYKSEALLALPYPGGRHPRIGFLDGAINPQRDTKFSVFAPWDEFSYVVVDLPEALWSNLGLTYLAHKHIPTVWDNLNPGFKNAKQEWVYENPGSTLTSSRLIPNKEHPILAYHVKVVPGQKMVGMEIELENLSDKKLSSLSVQVCNHLKGMDGFQDQNIGNYVNRGSIIAKGNREGDKWIITGWEKLKRTWNNPPVPCIHSDPEFEDCEPGAKVKATGFITFYQGSAIEQHLGTLQDRAFKSARELLLD